MPTQPPKLWWLRIATFLLAALASASAAYWALKWSATAPPASSATLIVASASPSDPQVVARLLGGGLGGSAALAGAASAVPVKSLAGVDIVHVPYRGAVFTDVIGGRVTMTLQNMGAILPVVKDGRLRGVAVTSLKRSPIVDLPTVAESGLPGFEAISWFGLMAPAGTPAPIVAKAHRQAAAIVAMPDVREKLTQLGFDIATDGPDAMGAVIKADIAKWAKVIKDANIKAGD